MLTQTSTPVPLRIAKRIILGTVLTAIAYGACISIHDGLELGAELTVETALWRVASLALPPTAQAQEIAPAQITSTAPVPAVVKPFFKKPALGIDWGIIHGNNGVDIANKCGTDIVAAAAGIVTEIGSGWNGGYGNAVNIEHSNGTNTYYAHLSQIDVVVAQEVAQGDVLGLMGVTGKSTGCHVHFEVRGGDNPFGA